LTPLPFDEPLEITYWNLWDGNGALARHGAAMGSPAMTWKGMKGVGSDFYGKFLAQLLEVAGQERGEALIAEYVTSSAHHDWLNHPQKGNPILGYGKGKRDED
jgi:hypothetical protein